MYKVHTHSLTLWAAKRQRKKMQFNLIWNHGHMSPHAEFEYHAPFVTIYTGYKKKPTFLYFRFHSPSVRHLFLFYLSLSIVPFSFYAMIKCKQTTNHLCDMVFFSVIFFFHSLFILQFHGWKCDNNRRDINIDTKDCKKNNVKIRSIFYTWIISMQSKTIPFVCHRFIAFPWLNFDSREKITTVLFVVALFYILNYVHCCILSPRWNEKSTKFFK